MTQWTQLEEANFANLTPDQIIFEDRAREKYEDLDELAQTIKEKGLIQPIAVQATEDPNKYRLLAGGRRFSAMVLGLLSPIPARIFPATLSPLDSKEIELFENVYRMDLTWQEKAKLTREIHEVKTAQFGEAVSGGTGEEKRGHSMADTAEMLGKDRSGVSRDLQLADAIDKHPELAGAKNESEARRMLRKLEKQQSDRVATQEYEEKVKREGIENTQTRLSNGYIVGDFFEKIADVPDKMVHLVEIDPPYAIDLPDIKKTSAENVNGYTEVEASGYADFMLRTFQQAHRVLLKDGWLICWYAHQYYQLIIDQLTTAGFTPCPIPAFWVKPIQGQTNAPETRMGSTIEPFIYARKGNAVLRQQGRSNCFTFHPVADLQKSHPTERPIEMMEEIIKVFVQPNTNLMIPYLGSGNTLLAAANVGVWGYGFDLDADNIYKNSFVRKVSKGEPGKYKSYDTKPSV